GLELRAAGWKRDRSPEVVAFGEEFQDLRPGRTEGAVARAVLREGGRRERRGLIGKPVRAVDQSGSLVGPAPGTDLLPSKEVADGGDRSDRFEDSLVVPAADARVEYRVREGKEEFDVAGNPVFVRTMMVPAGDILGEQVPVPGGQRGAGPVRPVSGDPLMLI